MNNTKEQSSEQVTGRSVMMCLPWTSMKKRGSFYTITDQRERRVQHPASLGQPIQVTSNSPEMPKQRKHIIAFLAGFLSDNGSTLPEREGEWELVVLLAVAAAASAARPNYNFQYAVQDSRNNFGHEETRQLENTNGRFFAQLPDGRLQQVNYRVDGNSGFLAEVTYDGEARFPDSDESFESRGRRVFSAPSSSSSRFGSSSGSSGFGSSSGRSGFGSSSGSSGFGSSSGSGRSGFGSSSSSSFGRSGSSSSSSSSFGRTGGSSSSSFGSGRSGSGRSGSSSGSSSSFGRTGGGSSSSSSFGSGRSGSGRSGSSGTSFFSLDSRESREFPFASRESREHRFDSFEDRFDSREDRFDSRFDSREDRFPFASRESREFAGPRNPFVRAASRGYRYD
ncbi:hypothetical protein O3P69_016074 [Scylla paramamosain]|uniref:Uncharacterized protein n=1 Tax=Scylla paramamosain TaxID=85552 RepID=A0AAW0TCB4_SCYPA